MLRFGPCARFWYPRSLAEQRQLLYLDENALNHRALGRKWFILAGIVYSCCFGGSYSSQSSKYSSPKLRTATWSVYVLQSARYTLSKIQCVRLIDGNHSCTLAVGCRSYSQWRWRTHRHRWAQWYCRRRWWAGIRSLVCSVVPNSGCMGVSGYRSYHRRRLFWVSLRRGSEFHCCDLWSVIPYSDRLRV